jgi:hypothetical protein
MQLEQAKRIPRKFKKKVKKFIKDYKDYTITKITKNGFIAYNKNNAYFE